MVEILISVAVIMVSVLGMASLQMVALKHVSSSYQRTQAINYAYDLTDRLRANRGAADIASSALGGAYDGVTLCNANSRHAKDERACDYDAILDFTGTSLSDIDLKEWWDSLDSSGLKNWHASIDRTGNRFLISIQWDDSHVKSLEADETAQKTSCTGDSVPLGFEEVCVATEL